MNLFQTATVPFDGEPLDKVLIIYYVWSTRRTWWTGVNKLLIIISGIDLPAGLALEFQHSLHTRTHARTHVWTYQTQAITLQM